MSDSCEILVTEWDGRQVVAGEIIFDDGKLSVSATKGYEVLMENVMEDEIFVGETCLIEPMIQRHGYEVFQVSTPGVL